MPMMFLSLLVALTVPFLPKETRFDGSVSLQSALDTGAGGRVKIARGSWNVDPSFVRNGTEVVFEDGAELVANPKGFFGIDDCVLNIHSVSNVIVRGGLIRMWRKDYLAKKDGRPRSQHRTGISLRGAGNILIEDMKLSECGGDGIYVANVFRSQGGCSDIVIRRCAMDHGLRQGMSVIDVRGLTVEDCRFESSEGENPQCGVDFEPNHAWQSLERIVMRRCQFIANRRAGACIYVPHLNSASRPVDITFEDCSFIRNESCGISLSMKNHGDFPRGKVTLRRCRIEGSFEEAVQIGQKPLGSIALELVDTLLVSNAIVKTARGDIRMLSRFPEDTPPDDITFSNVRIIQGRKGEFFTYDHRAAAAEGKSFRKLSGDITVTDPSGTTQCHNITPDKATALFPLATGK